LTLQYKLDSVIKKTPDFYVFDKNQSETELSEAKTSKTKLVQKKSEAFDVFGVVLQRLDRSNGGFISCHLKNSL